MLNKIVYLSVEIKKREFTAKCFFATVLAHFGYTVIICPQYYARKLAMDFEQGLFFDKNYRHNKADEWRRIKNNGSLVFAWHEEAALRVFEEEFKYDVSSTTFQLAKKIFLWGNIEKNAILELGYNGDSLCVVGNPRIDLLSKDPFIFYKESIKKIKRKYDKFILINLNYPYNRKINIDSRLERAKTMSETPLSTEQIQRLKDRYYLFQAVLQEDCKMVDELSNLLNINIVIRPHPSETDINYWKRRFSNKKNVFIDNSGDSNAWTCASELMIHSGCTTALEAFVLKKFSIYYNPIMEKAVGADFSVKAKTIQEVISIVNDFLEGRIDSSELFEGSAGEFTRDLVMFDDKETASERIANFLNQIEYCDESDGSFNLRGGLDVKYGMFKDWIKSLLGRYWSSKFEYTCLRETKRIVKSSSEVMGYSDRIDISHPGTNIFVIKKK